MAVRLEPVDGMFIEGFEVGLRFEDADGAVLDTVLWSDFVSSQDGAAAQDYYGSVLEQSVPAGPVVVLAAVNIGIGPPPETPDLDGELRCRLELEVPEGETVEVEVLFADEDCLRAI